MSMCSLCHVQRLHMTIHLVNMLFLCNVLHLVQAGVVFNSPNLLKIAKKWKKSVSLGHLCGSAVYNNYNGILYCN